VNLGVKDNIECVWNEWKPTTNVLSKLTRSLKTYLANNFEQAGVYTIPNILIKRYV